MLSIKTNEPITIKIARRGKMQNGDPYALVTICESDNSESKSRSTVKAWGTELDENIKDGCKAVLKAFDEVRIVHEKYGEKYGKPLFHDVFEIRGAVWMPYEG